MSKELTRLVLEEKNTTIRRLEALNVVLLVACKEGRDAAAALMRAIQASGYGAQVMDEMEPGYDGFGVLMDKAIALAESVQLSSGERRHDANGPRTG